MARQANIHNRMKRRAQQVIKRRKKQANRQKKAEHDARAKARAQRKAQNQLSYGPAESNIWNG